MLWIVGSESRIPLVRCVAFLLYWHAFSFVRTQLFLSYKVPEHNPEQHECHLSTTFAVVSDTIRILYHAIGVTRLLSFIEGYSNQRHELLLEKNFPGILMIVGASSKMNQELISSPCFAEFEKLVTRRLAALSTSVLFLWNYLITKETTYTLTLVIVQSSQSCNSRRRLVDCTCVRIT